MKMPGNGAGAAMATPNSGEGEKKSINPELWQACAGPLASLPAAGSHVVYFPQGHSEQVAASMKKNVDAQIPNYPNLPSKLLCILHSVTLHADPETDEVYAQMTLQPVPSFDKEALLRSDLSMKSNRPQTEFFCKTLTASDTSTHGGFSVPRRAAEKIFPPLDFTMQPPAQELVARDLHDSVWTFRHIYRGQPKRHLLTTGWSIFVSGKRLFAGDSVLFIRDEKQQLLLGIRRANRQPPNLSSSVLSSDSMHIGILAAAAHAAANNSPFTVFYNPRASPSEFVIPLAKYHNAVCTHQISLGMRFRMLFETEESGTRRYMGTITGISDLDSVRWKNSQWRNLQVGWDESTAGERRNRVSVWEIEPVTAPFFICPTPSFFRPKRPRQPGMPDDECSDLDSVFKRTMPWFSDDMCMKDPQSALGGPGLSLVQWMNMQQQLQNPNTMTSSVPSNYLQSIPSSVFHNLAATSAGGPDLSCQLGMSGLPQMIQQNNLQFSSQRPNQKQPSNNLDQQLQKLTAAANMVNPMGSIMPPQNLMNQTLPVNQNLMNQTLPVSQNHMMNQQQPLIQNSNNQLPNRNIAQNLQHQQQQPPPPPLPPHQHHQSPLPPLKQQLPEQVSPENQIQFQLLQKLHQQQQLHLAQHSSSQLVQMQDHPQKQTLDASYQTSSRPITTTTTTTTTQMMEMPQQVTNARFAQQLHNQKLQQPQSQPAMLPELASHVGPAQIPTTTTNQGQSGVTDDIPSCSTSPSANNCPSLNPPLSAQRGTLGTMAGDQMEKISRNMVKDLQQIQPDIKPSSNQGFLAPPQTYVNSHGIHLDYLDSSSSATSICLSQNDVVLHQNNNYNSNPMALSSQSMMYRDNYCQEDEVQENPRNNNNSNMSFVGANNNDEIVQGQLGTNMPLIANDSLMMDPGNNNGIMLSSFDDQKEAQPELSSSMVSQSFGVPDMAFNSIDSALNDNNGFLSTGGWAPPPPQFQRMRTYTKTPEALRVFGDLKDPNVAFQPEVYKRGAVGRSIDITRYSGYEELKHDLARRFGIEGQLEDRQRIGWKLVYVDHEKDVLLVGDDPWEEFVNCVRCIKILSPQEVQQMSLDGDLGANNVLSNQACSSSDGGM